MANIKMYDDNIHSVLCSQLAMIYENGLVVEDGLILLAEHDSVIDYKQLLKDYREDNQILNALKKNGRIDNLLLSSFEVATQIGQEESILNHLSLFYKRKAKYRQELKDLLTLPFILFSILIIVLNVLSLVVLPIFQSIFINLGGNYPIWISFLLVGLNIISSVGIIALFVFALWALVVTYNKHKNPSANDVIDHILQIIPKRIYKSDLAYFSYLVEIMVESGVDNHTALSLIFDYLPKRTLYQKLKATVIDEKDSIIDLILKSNIYPSFTQNSIRLAYKSGNLEKTLKAVSETTQADADHALEKMFNQIEPIVLIFLALGVGSVLLSLLVPLLQAMQTLGF